MRLGLVGVAAAAGAVLAMPPDGRGAEHGWEALRELRPETAVQRFAAAARDEPWARLGRALAQVHLPRAGPRDVAAAVRELESIGRSDGPAELRAAAWMALARVEEVHRPAPDWAAAAAAWARAREAAPPGHLWGELATVRELQVRLAAGLGAPAELAAMWDRIDPEPPLERAATRFAYHWLRVKAGLWAELPAERIWPAVEAALASDWPLEYDQWLTAGELARRVGAAAAAARCYRAFLAEYPTDERVGLVRLRLAEVEATGGAAAPSAP